MIEFLLTLARIAYSQVDHRTTLFIATDGDDNWSGKLAEPNMNRTDGPFATLEKARNTIREIKKDGLREPITVIVRGGKYFLNKPFILTKEDSGTRSCPITYTAYLNEKPVLSGGLKINEWKLYRDGIFMAELPWSKGGKWKSRQIFFNGKRQPRARYPKLDPSDPIYSGWALTESPVYEGSTDTFIYKPNTFHNHWSKPTEIEVIYWANIGGWRSMVTIKEIDEEKRIIRLSHSGWQFDVPGWYMPVTFTQNNRFYIENALEELTDPGEWCFDSEDGIIYFMPPSKITNGQDVVVPVLDNLIDINGASWINISGFTLTETLDGDNFHHEGVEGAGAMYPRPGWRYCGDAVHLKGAEHCRIENNLFDCVGGNAVYLDGYNSRNIIIDNEISGAGANGVCLLGTKQKHPIFNCVTKNYIHHCGTINKYTAGIFTGMSDGNIISNNRIEHLPHHGINLSNSPYGRNIVEYNDIRWVDEEVADSAAINCWMEDPPDRNTQRCGHVIRFNYISDVYGCEVIDGKVVRSRHFPSSGIYLDNYTSNCFVYGNIIVRCAHSGIIVHAGKNNIIENNIIVDSPRSITFQDYVSGMDYWKQMAGFMTGNHVLRNIFFNSISHCRIFGLHAWTDRVIAQSNYNLFFNVFDSEYAIDDFTNAENPIANLVQWKQLGYDEDSIIADPLFFDPGNDDYRLRPESPAFDLGFMPLAVSPVGKPATKSDYM